EVERAGGGGGGDGGARDDGLHLAALAVEDVGAEARRIAAVLRHRQQVDGDVVVENRDVRVALHGGEQRALNLAAGDVLPVDDAVARVRALAADVERAVLVAIEAHADVEQAL